MAAFYTPLDYGTCATTGPYYRIRWYSITSNTTGADVCPSSYGGGSARTPARTKSHPPWVRPATSRPARRLEMK